MNRLEMHGELRALVGNPSLNEVSARDLESYLTSSLEWLAEELHYVVRTDDHFGLVAGQQEYPLPPEVGTIVWVEWNGVKLDSATTYRWDREGIVWRTQAASTPREFAIQGRNLILMPPPDAASITADPELSIRFFAATPGLSASGTPYLSDLDQWVALYEAACLYCGAHPSDENQMRIQEYEKQVARRLTLAKRRAEAPIEDDYPSFHVAVGRLGGAR